MKLMSDMAGFMRVCSTLRQIGGLREESWKETLQMVLESNKPGIGLSFFSFANWNILRNC